MASSDSKNYVHQTLPLHEVTQQVVATAMGREPADLIIRNARLVNVNIVEFRMVWI